MVPPISGVQTLSKTMKVDQLAHIYCYSRDSSVEVDCGASKASDGDSSITNVQMDGSPEKSIDMTSAQGIDVELRFSCEPTSNNEDCSTSGSHQLENLRVQQRSRTLAYAAGERSKRKRWRGRHDDLDYSPSFSSDECSKQELSTTTLVSSSYKSKEQQVMVFLFSVVGVAFVMVIILAYYFKFYRVWKDIPYKILIIGRINMRLSWG